MTSDHRPDKTPSPPGPGPGKSLLVYNPAAGERVGLDQITTICRLFSERGWRVLPVPTQGPGTAPEIIRAFSQEVESVIVLGGDGTVNEALQALVGTRLSLGVLPGGTANVIARELGMPRHLEKAVVSLTGGVRKRVTAGRAAGRYFLAWAGVGFDAVVCEQVSARMKRRIGRAAFVLEALRQAARYDFPPVLFTGDGQQWQAPFGVVANTRRYGGSLHIAPEASMEDPALDMCLFRGSGFGSYARHFVRLLLREHTRHPDVVYRKVQRVEISSQRNIPYQLDGELAGHLPLVIECVPQALELIFPGAG